jgi:uncharacterized protein YhjY with autotransporter beta-barrel domain
VLNSSSREAKMTPQFHVRGKFGRDEPARDPKNSWRTCALALLFVALLISNAMAIASPEAGDAAHVTLQALEPSTEPLSASTDSPTTLTVIGRIGEQGVAGKTVHWKVSPSDDAILSHESSITAAGDDKNLPGATNVKFTAHRAGRYVVTVSTQNNPDCVGNDCATYDEVEFPIDVAAAAANTEEGGHHTAAWAGAAGAGAALILLANQHGDNTPTVRSLTLVSGDSQSAAANSPLSSPLVVRASNDDRAASSVAIIWTASGGATLSASSTATDSSGTAQVTVTSVGPGPGPVTVTATRSDFSVSVSFTVTVLNKTLVQISGNGQSAPTSTQVPNPLVVEARLGSTPQSGIGISWAVVSGDATISSVSNGGQTNGAGQSSAVIDFGPTPGPVVVTATRVDAPTISQTFTLTSTLTRSLSIVSGDNQTAAPNTPLPSPLIVNAQNNGANAPGVTINWIASGGATLSSPSSVTDGAGNASVTVTSTGPGPDPFTVTAVRADDPSGMVVFNENVLPPVLTKVAGDGQSGLTGSAATVPLKVLLVDGGGVPVAGQTISWSVTSGAATVTSGSSVTDGAGNATMTFSYGATPGPITINASAYGGTQSVDFSETAVTASSLQKTSGDNQNGNPGATIAPFVVTIVPPAGVTDLSGVPITFTITSGTGTLSVTSTTTDVSGQASTQLTLGLTPGTVTVVAQVTNGPSATFTALINGSLVATTLTIVSGDAQTLATGVPSQPMVVVLKDGGVPLPGQTITWSTNNGTVSPTSSVTNASGQASTTVTPASAGAVVVTADFAAIAQYTASSVSFTQNTTIASLPNLTTDQAAVAVALDNACSALVSQGTLTTAEQDLLDQCQGLASASGSNPGGVANAIDEMMPDVAQTQTQTGQAAVNAQFDNLKGRIATLRAGNFGSSFGGLALSTSSGSVSLGSLAASLMDEGTAAKTEQDSFQRWGFFASGNIGRGVTDANANAPKYDFDIKGLTVGVDYRQSDKLILGMALGYTHQDSTLAGGEGSLDMHGYSLSGYTTVYRANSWYMDSVITLASNRFAHRRRIVYSLPGLTVDQLAKASSDGTDSSVTFTLGRDFNRKEWNFGLYGRAQYGVQGFDGFEEELDASAPGSGLGLRIEDRTVRSLSSTLGGKASFTHSVSWGVIAPQFGLEWQREYNGDPDAFRAFLVSDPTGTPILITGDAQDNSYFRFNLGLSMVLTRGRSGFIQYDRIFGRDGMSQDNLSLGIRIEF